MSEFTVLKACPFCGSAPNAPTKAYSKGGQDWTVLCSEGCIALTRETLFEAVRDWNIRKDKAYSGDIVISLERLKNDL